MSTGGSKLCATFNVIPNTVSEEFCRFFPGFRGTGLSRSEPGGCVMGSNYGQHAEKLYNFQVRPDDIWIVTMPKCGTTWSQEMVWLLANDCDIEAACRLPLGSRSPFFEFRYMAPEEILPSKMLPLIHSLEQLDDMPSPRVIKTHLPFHLLPPKLLDTCKVVYVARNPKDVIVSYYFHHQIINFQRFEGSLEQFAHFFMNDEVYYTPFFPHVLDAWSKRNHPNLHFKFYEDMKKDLRGEIKKLASFLKKTLTEDQLDQMENHLRIDNFRANESVNYEPTKELGFIREGQATFVRQGKTGDWKNHLSETLNLKLDEWISHNLEGTDLSFTTELEHQD